MTKKKFLAIYLGSATNPKAKQWESLDEKAQEEKEKLGIKTWGAWVQKHKRAMVDMGTPIGKTKRVDAEGASDTKNQITGYAIVEAESHSAAAELFLNHPHFTIFPGDSVEIMECLEIPEA